MSKEQKTIYNNFFNPPISIRSVVFYCTKLKISKFDKVDYIFLGEDS